MTVEILTKKDKDRYDSFVIHPVQSWGWGDFQLSQGHQVYRLAHINNDGSFSKCCTLSFHQIPKTPWSIGTLLRGPDLDQELIDKIYELSIAQKAIFVKLEPNTIYKKYDNFNSFTLLNSKPTFKRLKKSPKSAFYPFTYLLDLSLSENKLLEQMHSKTRYNIRVANRFSVEVKEQTDDSGFEIYLKLLLETTKRQGFYLHTEKYHRDLWKQLKKSGMLHILTASYNNQVLSAFMVFQVKDLLFYPYGSSLDVNRHVMAPTLLMWEVIKLGKKLNCKIFDMWGSLGPNAKEGDNGFGFHRFKQGFGGQLNEYIGTYDLIINPFLYFLYNFADKIRWKILRLKASIFKK